MAAKNFAKLVFQPPPPFVKEEKEHDPMDFIDDYINSAVRSVKYGNGKLKENELRRLITNVCDSMDWLPPELVELVEAHCCCAEDVDEQGRVNKIRLTMQANALFLNVKDTICFANFYQLKQFASLFAKSWGFHLVTSNNTQLTCFSVKNGCKFVIRSVCLPEKTKTKFSRHRRPVRISTVCLDHNEGCCPRVQEDLIGSLHSGISYHKASEACGALAGLIVSNKGTLGETLYSSVLELLEIARGESARDIQSVTDAARHSTFPHSHPGQK